MKFFLDVCLSVKYAKILKILMDGLNHTILHHSERFPGHITDIEWVGELAKEGGWVIVSADVRITKCPAEREAWHESGLTAFFFDGRFPERNIWVQLEEIARWWPKIIDNLKKAKVGSGFKMPFKGTACQLFYEP